VVGIDFCVAMLLLCRDLYNIVRISETMAYIVRHACAYDR